MKKSDFNSRENENDDNEKIINNNILEGQPINLYHTTV